MLFKRVYCLVFFLMFIVASGQSQNFALFYQQGDSLMQSGEYQAALNAYTDAFDVYIPNHPLSYINPAIAAVEVRNVDLAIYYLEQSVHFGLDDTKLLAYFSENADILAHPKWQEIQNTVTSRKKEIDDKLKTELEEIYAFDQVIRKMHNCIGSTSTVTKAEYEAFQLLATERDSLNLGRLEAIIKTHGWPSISKVGNKANQTAWLVIQHANLEKQLQYLPILRASVEEGESLPKHLALLMDRVLVRQGKRQLYGTQINTDLSPPQLHPIEDIQNVDRRREKVGLEPLKDYLIQLGVPLNSIDKL